MTSVKRLRTAGAPADPLDDMNAIDLFWHLAGLVAVPLLAGGIAAAAARLLWRDALGALPWWRLCLRVAGAAAAVQVLGLVALGGDGRMATYGGVVLAIAAVLGWSMRRRRAA